MADQDKVDQASRALGELHREIIHGDKNMWDFVVSGNAFLASEREVQVAALEKYNRGMVAKGSPELQVSPADFIHLF